MSRKLARENALKLIYEYCIVREDNPLTLESLSSADEMSTEDIAYLTDVYRGIIAEYDELTAIVDNLSKGFALERVYKIDLAILLLALYEIRHTDIPPSVSVNEAVELCKRYSTEKSSSFVNGILAAYLNSVDKKGEEK